MNRINALLALTLTLTLAAIMPAQSSMAGASGGKPNVLLIAIDDMNDWVGCLGGHPDGVSPNIDRLGKRGMHLSVLPPEADIANRDPRSGSSLLFRRASAWGRRVYRR